MSKVAYRLFFGLALCAAALLTGCYYMPGQATGNARAALNVKSIPPNMSSIALVVTAPDMATIYDSYPATAGSISLAVPAGSARTFTLLLNNISVSLEGQATVDLQPGETKEVMLQPSVAGTQIIVPDHLRGRLVQINDMSGTGWKPRTVADFTGGMTFSPYDVDFDGQGRIYVTNDSPNSTEPIGKVLRFDDIDHPASFQVVDTNVSGMKALAVDRTNGLIYYTTGSTTLYQKSLSNIAAPPTQFTTLSSDINLFTGSSSIAVDSQGYVYLVNYSTSSFVVKYDTRLPAGPSRVIAKTTYVFTQPWGVMVKEPYVYVTDFAAKKVVRFDMNLNFVNSFGGPTGDPFYGPEQFVAVLNKKITVIDEQSGADRLVSFDDMTGAGWTTFGTTGSGQNQFGFYSFC